MCFWSVLWPLFARNVAPEIAGFDARSPRIWRQSSNAFFPFCLVEQFFFSCEFTINSICIVLQKFWSIPKAPKTKEEEATSDEVEKLRPVS